VKRFFSPPALLVFLGVSLLLVAANRELLFSTPWYEGGDIAVNALQIDRAKHLDEIHGNYSRFHFFHPGPAFFYVYAAGEYLFHDWLKVVPAPHNAHILAGLLLQCAFLSTALGIAAGQVKSRLFLPLALLVGGIHFALAGNAFTSIWPPHVLLMPFLCFLVAGASVAAGRIGHLPVAVLAACFLAHGHVAQSLFVVPMFLIICSLYLLQSRTRGGNPSDPSQRPLWPHLLALACLGLFLLPLLLDLMALADSNAADILRFLRAGEGDTKSLAHSLAYLLSFFTYFHDQDMFLPESGVGDPGFIWSRAAWFLVWIPLVILTGRMLARLNAPDRDPMERCFGLTLCALVAVSLVLSVIWGIMQTGAMFEFNSHFNYAVIYALLLLACAAVSRLLPNRGSLYVGIVCCAGGAVGLWQGVRAPVSINAAVKPWIAATAAALQADPHSGTRKLLVFAHDDWIDVATTALALQRGSDRYLVDGNWSFMFGRQDTFAPPSPDFDLQGISVWRFTHQPLPGHHWPMPNGLFVNFDPLPLDPAGFTLEFGHHGNAQPYVLLGLAVTTADSAWTTLPIAALQFSSPAVSRDVIITIQANPHLIPGFIDTQPMDLFVNRRKVGSVVLVSPQTTTFRVPAEVWNLTPTVTMALSFPRADSLLQLGLTRDPRKFAWMIQRMTFALAEPPATTAVP
jgi:hypothetical protein